MTADEYIEDLRQSAKKPHPSPAIRDAANHAVWLCEQLVELLDKTPLSSAFFASPILIMGIHSLVLTYQDEVRTDALTPEERRFLAALGETLDETSKNIELLLNGKPGAMSKEEIDSLFETYKGKKEGDA